MQEKSIMSYESVLPPDFNGTFTFSNPSKEDFVGIWGGKEYLFPAESTVPLIMLDYSPLEIQSIRKKFAYDLAVREWFKSKDYKTMRGQEGTPGNRTMNSIHQAAQYTLSELTPYIQKCLEELPVSELLVRPAKKVKTEDLIHTKDDGSLNTEVITSNVSLRKRALEA